MTDRIEREKEYHNIAFSEGIRKSADKYYTIHKISFQKLTEQIKLYGEGKDVLEYGCGPGSHSFIISKYAKSIISIDISDFAINNAKQLAEEKSIKNLQFIEMNAELLDFESGRFDVIFGNAIIHHLNLEKSFSEINRVLKPGGRAFFYEPLGHNFFINLYRRLTPGMRTVDEHPLLNDDIKFIRKYFDHVNVRYYHLTTIMAVPFRNIKAYERILHLFYKTDTLLFKIFPFFRKYAWYCSIEIIKKR